MHLSATLQGPSKIGRQGSTHLTKPVECIEQERAQKFPFLLGERVQLPFHLQVSQVQRATWDRTSKEHTGLHLLPLIFAWTLLKTCNNSNDYLEQLARKSNSLLYLPLLFCATEHLSLHHKPQISPYRCRRSLQICDRSKSAGWTLYKVHSPYLVRHQSPPGSHCFVLQCRVWAIGNRVIGILVILPLGKEK